MRYLGVVILMGLTIAVVALPDPAGPVPGDDPSTVIPPVSVCPLLEAGERSTTLAVLSSVSGPGLVTGFAAGSVVAEAEYTTGSAGSATVAATDLGVVGAAGGLVEMPSDTSAAGVVIGGSGSLAGEACVEAHPATVFITGGSTAGDDGFLVQILNPFAGEAVVNLTVTTDAGIESDERFDAVRVPASSTTTLDLGEIVPGRAFISVDVATSRGAVLVVARQSFGDDLAVWNAVEPAQDWWLPIPAGNETKELVLASPVNTDIEYQIDYYGQGGYEEGFSSGVVGARDMVRVPLSEESDEASGVRIISTGPVVTTLQVTTRNGRAVTTASPVDATTWLLPGATGPRGGSGSVVVLNTGLDEVSVRVRALGEREFLRDLELSSEGTLSVNLVAADGYRVEASGPVVALWYGSRGRSTVASMGTPLLDG